MKYRENGQSVCPPTRIHQMFLKKIDFFKDNTMACSHQFLQKFQVLAKMT